MSMLGGLLRRKRDGSGQPEAGGGGRRRPQADDAELRRPQAFSYYSQRSDRSAGAPAVARTPLDVPKQRLADRLGYRPGHNRVVLVIAASAVLGISGYLLALSPNPKVVTRTAGGNVYFLQATAVYQQTAVAYLSHSLLNRNKLTVDADGLARELTAQYPEIDSASLQLPLIGQQATLTLEPNRPSFILTTTSSAAFLLDDSGRAVISTSQITDPGELAVPTLQDKSGTKITLGKQALPKTTVAFIEAFLGYLKAANVEYTDIVLPAAAGELDVTIGGTPYFVKTNLMGEARLQAGTFLAAQGRLAKDKVIPAQYIDVRVPERAYYK